MTMTGRFHVLTIGLFATGVALAGTAAAQSRSRLALIDPSDAEIAAAVARVSPGNHRLPTFIDNALSEQRAKTRGFQGRNAGEPGTAGRGKIDHERDDLSTIPHWNDTFKYHGLTYKYTMVGTDPKRGSATTRIPTVLIPLRFVFSNGQVFDASADSVDGQTSVQGIIGSPVFQPVDFTVDGIHVGETQYGDAFQRANFWRSVSTSSRDYHVLLDRPVVAPPFEVRVPDDAVVVVTDPDTGEPVPVIDGGLLSQATSDAVRQSSVSPQALPIVVWGNVFGFGFAAFHGATVVPDGVQTYISTGYHPRHIVPAEDVYALTHEVLEWLNDPFGDNFTPGWNFAGVSASHCQSRFVSDTLEVADVVEFFLQADVPVKVGATMYHLSDAVFLDYFTRETSSRSINGHYTFFGLVSLPSSPCAGHVEVDMTRLEYPGATGTSPRGINNQGWIVGDFTDASFRHHGFLYDGRSFRPIDYPGSVWTFLFKVSNAGQIAGAYVDSDGVEHGFGYFHDTFTPLDVPGTLDHTSVARGVNSRNEIVGEYDVSAPITHGFSYSDGLYKSIDTPFGQQAEATDINDWGLIVGDTYDDPFNPPIHGFLFDGISFAQFDFPNATETFPETVNNRGMHGGLFIDPQIGGFGYVTILGYPYEVYARVLGMNDLGQIVGYRNEFVDCDPSGFCQSRRIGYVGRLPRTDDDHDRR